MSKSILAILVLAVLGCAHAIIAPGPCPAVTLTPNFNIKRYTGKWYQWAGFGESNSKCVQNVYTLRSDNSINITSSNVNIDTNVPSTSNFYAVETANSQFDTIFSDHTAPFSVLEIDYTSYRVTYKCEDQGDGTHYYTAWIAGRQRIAPEKLYQKAVGVLKKYNLDTTQLKTTIQTADCDQLLQG